MARGLPDFGIYAAKTALTSMVDSGELAVRLGALSRYDRLGDVVFFEDFCSDLGAWEVEIDGAGAGVVVSAARKVSGGFSCRVTSGRTLEHRAGLRGRFPVPYSVTYGLEIAATPHINADHSDLMVDVYTGTHHMTFGIRFGYAAAENYYYNAAGGWTIIPGGLFVLVDDHYFVVVKFTFNITTMRYGRLLVPPRTFDLSENSGFIEVLPAFPRMEVWGRLVSLPATNAVSYIDNFIITANDV